MSVFDPHNRIAEEKKKQDLARKKREQNSSTPSDYANPALNQDQPTTPADPSPTGGGGDSGGGGSSDSY